MIDKWKEQLVQENMFYDVVKSRNICHNTGAYVFHAKTTKKGEQTVKNKTTALILSVLVGGLGVDRFYLGYTGLGILKLLTAGCFGILYIIDIINIATGNLLPADGSPYEDEASRKNAPEQEWQEVISPYEQLEKLSALHNQGVLTDEEYNKLKASLLAKI